MSLWSGSTWIDAVFVLGGTGLKPIDVTYLQPGTYQYTVPPGAEYIDVVVVGGGGGGNGSAGGITADGSGGGAGQWCTPVTLKVGVDINVGEIITTTIGAGGKGGTAAWTVGSDDGENSVVTARSRQIIGYGGKRANESSRHGGSVPPLTYNGRTYPGGAGGNGPYENGSDGSAPGGGGQGGESKLTSRGGGAGGAGGANLYVYATSAAVSLATSVHLGPTQVWPYVPKETVYNTVGTFTYNIPDDARRIDVIAVGAGGGGNSGGGGMTNGGGGGAGNWAAKTLVRGVDIPWTTKTITVQITNGGIGTTSPGTAGSGGTTTVSATGWAGLTATGGQGGKGQGTTLDGYGAGNYTFNNRTYVGGAPTGTNNSTNDCSKPGNSPGGGASGGKGAVSNIGVGAGGNGAPGGVWLYAHN